MHGLAVEFGNVLIVKDYLAACRLVKAKDGFHQARFATSAFAHDRNRFAAADYKSNAIHRFDIPGATKPETPELEPDVQVIDVQ